MMSLGLISGFVFLYEPNWPPSSLLHRISKAIVTHDNSILPSINNFIIMMVMALGMFSAALRNKSFKLVKTNKQQILLHTTVGVGMGIGASLALGGNSSQLLLALPALSPAGFIAISSIILGIRIGLYLRDKYII